MVFMEENELSSKRWASAPRRPDSPCVLGTPTSREAAGPPVQLEPVDLSVKTPVVLQVPRYSPAAALITAARRIPSPSTTPTPQPICPSTVLAFGSLIHARAVLTDASLDTYGLYFDFQVLGRCFFNNYNSSAMGSYQCSRAKNIKEYSVIESTPQGNDEYWQNLAVLILSEPFTLMPTLNIIQLARDPSDFDPHLCTVLYLMLLPNPHSSKEPIFDSPIGIDYKENYPKLQINWLDLQHKYSSHANLLDLPGSPVICLTKHEAGHWILSFLLHIDMEKNNVTKTLDFHFAMRDITYFHKTGMIDSIMRNSGLVI